MSEHVRLLDDCQSGEWDVLCPLCGNTIDEITAPIGSYETRCESCERWYFKTDAVCKSVGVELSLNEVREGFLSVANSAPKTIQIADDRTPVEGAKREVFNPTVRRMCKTITFGVEEGLVHE